MIGFGASSAGLAYLIQPIFDEVLVRQANLKRIATLIIALYIAKGSCSYLGTYLMNWVGQRTVMDLRNRLYNNVIKQSLPFFKENPTGTLISSITNDVEKIQLAISAAASDLLMQSFALVGYACLLFYYDWRLASFCLVTTPLAIYPLLSLGSKLRHRTESGLQRWRDITEILHETISGRRIVKAFRMESFESERFKNATDDLFDTNMRITRVLSVMPPIMELIGGGAIALALWYGSNRIAADEMTTGEFTSFMAALFMMYMPVKKLSRVNATLQQSVAAASRIFTTLDTKSEVDEEPNAIDIAPIEHSISFEKVDFHYENNPELTLRNISFTITAGQIVALVGASGAGKSTIVSLVPRFYEPTGGAILLDGIDIRNGTLSSLRKQIGLVTQEVILFNDSVYNNIAYGVTSASREQVEAAARAAYALDFINALPLGLDTVVGEGGMQLSGGQRQRIAIARAILKDPPILILDEATSALDAESEALVQRALENLTENRTTIVIAHRLSTVRRAHKIVVIDEGSVREIGTHDELLLEPQSAYKSLYELQFASHKQA